MHAWSISYALLYSSTVLNVQSQSVIQPSISDTHALPHTVTRNAIRNVSNECLTHSLMIKSDLEYVLHQ